MISTLKEVREALSSALNESDTQLVEYALTKLDALIAATEKAEPVTEWSWTRKYHDSTPKLHVGNSAFEDWFQQQPFATQTGIKQMCRDSYAAGMGDPLVTYITPQPAPSTSPLTVKQRVDIADACEEMDFDDDYLGIVSTVIDLTEAAHGIGAKP